MEITYDEYIATWQAPEAKGALDERIAQDSQKRFQERMALNSDYPQNNSVLFNMSKTEYESLRRNQMAQLYEVYRSAYRGENQSLLSIRPGTTDQNLLRRVVGEKGGYIYNTGIFALDYDTISAVSHIAGLRESTSRGYVDSEWAKSMSSYALEDVVDEMISAKNILLETGQITYDDIITGKIYRETDIAKRAIGKKQYQTDVDKLIDPAKVGKNCFGIKDYELSWDQLMERKSSLWAKTGSKLVKFIGKKIEGLTSKDDRRNNRKSRKKEIRR